MSLVILIIVLSTSVHSYNLDIKYPLIYTDPANNKSNFSEQDSYFGYSLLLVKAYDGFESQLFIGAPKGKYSDLGKPVKEPGITYECSMSGKCDIISPTMDSTPDIVVNQIGMSAKVIKDTGWFGASIVAIHPTLLKICAPRTKINLFKPFTDQYHETIQGICYYYSKLTDGSFLQIETDSLTSYNFSSPLWFNPQYGYSQNIAVGISPAMKLNVQDRSESMIRSLLKNTSMIVGNPTNQFTGSISIIQDNKRKTFAIPREESEEAEFGYAVTSGYYFGKNEVLFVSGAPAWKSMMGKVGIINSSSVNSPFITLLYGRKKGESFGASLTSGDLNNDGFDDLIIGSPNYGDKNGKVYIYLGNQNGFLDYIPVIEGFTKRAQFGYSLSCGDLDRDGFSDLIVGAPWEDSGVIYVYNGYGILDEKNELKVSQRISAVEISPKIKGFGFSISNLADIDDNGFADVAVGALKSGHAVILRAIPVERSPLNLKIQPATIKKISQRVSPEFCLKTYKNFNSQILKNYTFVVVVDSKHKRYNYDYVVWTIPNTNDTYKIFQYRYSSQRNFTRATSSTWNGCITSHFNPKANILNTVDPVDIMLTYKLESYDVKFIKNSTNHNFCKFCPIKYIEQIPKPIKLSVPYEIGCKNSVCDSDISVTTSLYGVGHNNTWEIGSGDITIEAKFQNHGDPAYLATANFQLSKGIHLKSILPNCQEGFSENLFIITCAVGNPFNNGMQKIISLNLDMKYFETHNISDINKQKLFVNLTVTSQTGNNKTKQISVPIYLKSNISVSITGNTDEDIYYLTNNSKKNSNISFQHVYKIFKYGKTPINQGQVIIEIPAKIKNSHSFLNLYKPQIKINDSVYNCVSKGIPFDSSLKSLDALNMIENNNNKHDKSSLLLNSRKRFADDVIDRLKFNESKDDFQEIANNQMINIDCLNDRVECGTIECDITNLKSAQDIGTIVLNFTVNLKELEKNLNIKTILQLGTRARVNVVRPSNNTAQTEVFTIFDIVEETAGTRQLSVWMILISIFIALITLSFITLVLYYMGFFQRKQKLELHYLNVNKSDSKYENSIEELEFRRILN